MVITEVGGSGAGIALGAMARISFTPIFLR